jgi:hypothetical protein
MLAHDTRGGAATLIIDMQQHEPTPDQQAVLGLLLRGKSYESVASDLGLQPEQIRDRALNGLESLQLVEGASLTRGERDRIGEFILGQTTDEALAVDSPAGARYAGALRNELKLDLPPVAPTQWSSETSAGSRKGGLVLLAVAGLAAVLIALAATGSFDSSDPSPSASASSTTSTSAPTPKTSAPATNGGTAANGWTIRRAYNLKATDGSSRRGVGAYETKAGNQALVFAATGMPASAVAGIWLLGGSKPVLVGFQKTDAKGQFTAITSRVPDGATKANQVVVTLEQYTPGGAIPSAPGQVVLQSPFSL